MTLLSLVALTPAVWLAHTIRQELCRAPRSPRVEPTDRTRPARPRPVWISDIAHVAACCGVWSLLAVAYGVTL